MVALVSPAFSSPPNEKQAIEDPNIAKSRYVFSPYLSLTTEGLLCGFHKIEPCSIRHVGKFSYPIRNPKRITDGPDSGEPAEVMHTRKPGHIFAGLREVFDEDLQVKTGFCEIRPLMGLEPRDNPADMELIIDVQQTLMPQRLPTWQEQVDALEAIQVQDKMYADIQTILRGAYETAANWGEAYVSHLKIALAQGANGNLQEGQSRIYAYDKAVCNWLGMETPEIASPLLKHDNKGFDLEGLAQVLAQSSREQMLALATLLKDAMVKPATGPEEVVPAVDTDTEQRRRKSLEERQAELRERNGK